MVDNLYRPHHIDRAIPKMLISERSTLAFHVLCRRRIHEPQRIRVARRSPLFTREPVTASDSHHRTAGFLVITVRDA